MISLVVYLLRVVVVEDPGALSVAQRALTTVPSRITQAGPLMLVSRKS